MSGRLENDSFKHLELKLNFEGNMADKIQNAYETSKNIYDDVLTQGNILYQGKIETDRLAGKKNSCKERLVFSTVSDGERA